ncbi:MAG TPA: DUF5947 family protein [Chthoniobacterales bacterium]|nr:DUF5947 family protein [Chthoniobacterales bacterium]
MSSSAFAALRRFAKPLQQPVLERCELCNLILPPRHRHLLEMTTRQVACSCDPCALLFQNAVGAKFKSIPRDARALPDFQMTDAEWENLALPIDLAFFFYSTPQEKMAAMYPSPAGPTESLLPLTSWETLVRQNPALQTMEADVEALLVNRSQGAREYFIAPMDACYELVGTIRMHWRGLSGGDAVWLEIEKFFAKLRAQSPVWKAPTPERNGA